MTPADATAAITHTLRLLPGAAAIEILRTLAKRWGLFRRSSAEHGLLFGTIAMAFDNWPEQHTFQPDDAEHLRAWLAIEAGHCDRFEAPAEVFRSKTDAIALAKFFCGGRKAFRAGLSNDCLVFLRPRSMSERELSAQDFRDMAANIYMIIEAESGITPELYKQEQEAQKRSRAQMEGAP